MTPYTKLQLHLERHMYKRGRHKGEAPADSARRGKNHFRVVKGNGGQMIVRMYNTDLIEVTPDNAVRISMGGWWTSTTLANINFAMRQFLGWGHIGSYLFKGMRQMSILAAGSRYRYYDGMTFTVDGKPTTALSAFDARVTDRDATKEFREDMAESGFKDVFPVLFAAAEPNRWWGAIPAALRKYVTSEIHANTWPEIAAHYKWRYDDHKAALKSITSTCTSDMKVLVDTDVTVI